MARGTTLGELVNQLRLALKLDPSPALSQNTVEHMKQMLREEQERLYDDFDWPFLKVSRDKALEAGQRYYDLPDDMNLERVISVDVLHAGDWIPVCRGIALCDYNAHDSDADERMDPARKWDVTDTGTGEQIEIWPIPATDGMKLRFSGIRKLRPLIENADIADLDDQIIVNFVAGEWLAGNKDASAQAKLAKATSRLALLQARAIKTRTNRMNIATARPIGGGSPEREVRVTYARAE